VHVTLEFPCEPLPTPGPPGAASAGAGGLRASSGTAIHSPSTPLVPGPGSAVFVAAEGLVRPCLPLSVPLARLWRWTVVTL
jgi:hypothetical protein